jgi:hypothetical protein
MWWPLLNIEQSCDKMSLKIKQHKKLRRVRETKKKNKRNRNVANSQTMVECVA